MDKIKDSLLVSPYPRIFWDGKTPAEYYGSWYKHDILAPKPLVQLGKISHFTSDLERESAWFVAVLNATLRYEYNAPDSSVKMRVFGFEQLGLSSIAQVHLVQRSDDATKGDYKVRDFEMTLNKAHAWGGNSKTKWWNWTTYNHWCGFDKGYDHHWDLDQTTVTLKQLSSRADAFAEKYLDRDAYYHWWNSPTNAYMAQPNGISIQLDAPCGNADGSQCSTFPYFDASLCGQGYCSTTLTSQCQSKLSARCGALGGQGTKCTDCAYQHIEALECENSEIQTFCINDSSELSEVGPLPLVKFH